ncbi:MAG: iron-sulfur cluster assembly scaffold protein [Promethearchaeota archaeon]
MAKNFNKFVRRFQRKIIQKDIEHHNENIVNLFYNPQNWGKLPEEEITLLEEMRGKIKGYLLGLYLKIENEIISKATFITDGCGVMVATGLQLTILITGKSIEYAKNLKPEDISNALMGIPPNEKHCTDLAIKTLKNAIKKYKHKN